MPRENNTCMLLQSVETLFGELSKTTQCMFKFLTHKTSDVSKRRQNAPESSSFICQ